MGDRGQVIEDAYERDGPKLRLGPARALGLLARLVATAAALATRGERPHVPLARRGGVSQAAIDAVPQWGEHGLWTPRQRALLAATDELHRQRTITGETWAALAGELRDAELIELCMLVGHYEMLAMTLNSLGVEPEPGALAALDGHAARTAERLRDALARSQR